MQNNTYTITFKCQHDKLSLVIISKGKELLIPPMDKIKEFENFDFILWLKNIFKKF